MGNGGIITRSVEIQSSQPVQKGPSGGKGERVSEKKSDCTDNSGAFGKVEIPGLCQARRGCSLAKNSNNPVRMGKRKSSSFEPPKKRGSQELWEA